MFQSFFLANVKQGMTLSHACSLLICTSWVLISGRYYK